MTYLTNMSALWWKRFQAKTHITYDEHRLLTFGVDGYPVEDLLDDQEVDTTGPEQPIRCSNCEFEFVDDAGDPVRCGEELVEALAQKARGAIDVVFIVQ